MIAFRKAHPVLAKGTLAIVEARDDFLSLVREHGGERLFAAFNLSSAPQGAVLPAGTWRDAAGSPFAAKAEGGSVMLGAWEAYFATGKADQGEERDGRT
jgi:alpha-glucosidase